MKKILEENKSKIFVAVISLVVIVVSALIFWGSFELIQNSNDNKVEKVLETLEYTESVADTEYMKLLDLQDVSPISDRVAGEYYKALTEISFMAGDDMEYNQFTAFARFYLERSGDRDSVIYLTNKYIGRLYSNGCYESAGIVLENINADNAMANQTVNMQASYYLSCADVAEMNDESPDEFLMKAQSAINLCVEGSEKNLNQAKHDMLKVRAFINDGDFGSATALLSKYSEFDDFGFGENQVYVICDYRVAFDEMMAKILLNEKDFENAYSYVDKYLDICDSFGFRSMKLRMLQYVVGHMDKDTNSNDAKNYIEQEKLVSVQNLNEMTNEYGQFLLTDIDLTMERLSIARKDETKTRMNILVAIIVFYCLILCYCIGAIFVDYLSRDGLTHLNNRRKYENTRDSCEKKKIPYCMLMMDIDDFKKVNDTYGHDVGDVVIRKISTILLSYSGRGISVFRYGGEELCIVMKRVPRKRALEIAQEICNRVREEVSTEDMRITISIGFAESVTGENVFRTADINLYDAKKNGKNQVRV